MIRENIIQNPIFFLSNIYVNDISGSDTNEGRAPSDVAKLQFFLHAFQRDITCRHNDSPRDFIIICFVVSRRENANKSAG